jgi:multidrug resistance efflux pump
MRTPANNTLHTLEQAGTFMDRVNQDDQYAMDHEHARWQAVMNAQQADWETTVSSAHAELENAQRELDQHWGDPLP